MTAYSISLLHSHDDDMVHCIKTKLLTSIDISTADIISINEAQFFPDLVHFVEEALRQKKQVYVYGLDGDFQRNKMGQLLDLIPHCDNIVKLKSKCLCGKDAIFTFRDSAETVQYLPNAVYIPLCRACYTIKKNNIIKYDRN
jgi:thymidine kinase